MMKNACFSVPVWHLHLLIRSRFSPKSGRTILDRRMHIVQSGGTQDECQAEIQILTRKHLTEL